MRTLIQSVGIYIVYFLCLMIVVWVTGTWFSNKISDYEVIKPEKGVACVVVSRMFNTSVDCWKED